jgi:hypothetical protein
MMEGYKKWGAYGQYRPMNVAGMYNWLKSKM